MTSRIIAGVDEVGRGPLAGPVMAGAVILDEKYPIEGLRDSKKLTEKARVELCRLIKKNAKCWAIGLASVKEIEEINILNASLLAMRRAILQLSITPHLVLVDGKQCPNIEIPAEAIIGGDDLIPEISAASILAKVTRDALMVELDKRYPKYGFAQHKGYATKFHQQAIKEHGITRLHRRGFAPIKDLLQECKEK